MWQRTETCWDWAESCPMNTYSYRTPPAQVRHPDCPSCGAELFRVQRTGIDRLVSVFKPVRRYCCMSTACGWEGRLPADPSHRAEARHYFL